MDRKLSDKPFILYLDDEQENLNVFRISFRRNYQVFTAQTAREAVALLREHPIQLIITDQRMPEVSGTEFLEAVIPEFPHIIRIVMTAYTDVESVIQAINKGHIYHYVKKPWDKDDLKITIDKALETYRLREENRSLVKELQDANHSLEEKVKERTSALEEARTELAKRYERLAEKNQMIDLLLRELNHRVLNNLQVVSVLLRRKIRESAQQELKDALSQINEQVAGLAQIHQELMYRRNNEVPINAQKYFKKITDILASLHQYPARPVCIRIHTGGLKFAEDDAFFLGFIVHELVTNALKYAFEHTPEPEITLHLTQQAPHTYRLELEDNGQGLPLPLFTEERFSLEKLNSLGLKIVNLIVRTHHGNLEIRNKMDAESKQVQGALFICTLTFDH